MKQNLFTLVAFGLLLFACKNEENTNHASVKIPYGGTLHLNEVESFKNLMPFAIDEVNNFHIASQVYEGLVALDHKLEPSPALARSWEIDSSGTLYTFHIRTGVYYHDDPCFKDSVGRQVRAQDVKFCFENLCSRNRYNRQFEVTFKDRVEGANQFYEESASGQVRNFSGITVSDDSTISIRLVRPDANLLNVLTMAGCFIYPPEAWQKYGELLKTHCVGTGPFVISSYEENKELVMTRNPRYWARDTTGQQLPYLDSVRWTFAGSKLDEIERFKAGKLDMIYRMPIELFHNIFGDGAEKKNNVDFEVYSSPALSTHFYGFNLQTNPFFSIREIRQAFNLAIDRNRLTDIVMKGEGRPADFGIVPVEEVFSSNGYNYKAIRGFRFNPDSARKLLVAAGYGGGKGLPPFTLEINSGGGERNLLVAMNIIKMLKENLGVTVNLSVVGWPEHIDNVQTSRTDFFRYAWVSDYADPESFLTLFYGKHVPKDYRERSYVNLVRFRNNRFDSLFEAATAQLSRKERFRLFSEAEQVVLDEAAFMPLFYDENFRIVKKHIHNLEENPLNYIDLRQVYFKKSEPKKAH